MTPNKTILILFHKNANRFSIRSATILFLSQSWKQLGYKVIHQFGVDKYVRADLIFLHIDLSVVPEEYIEYSKQYPAAVNANITDIRKRTISTNLVTPKSQWRGPVIVKSNLNYSGRPEYLHDYEKSWRNNVITRRLGLCSPYINFFLRQPIDQVMNKYEIFDSIDQVPSNVFFNDQFVVEKFIPEREGDYFCIRMYLFFGDKFSCRRIKLKNPIVKAINGCEVEEIEPHPIVNEWKDRFKIDYGKFDYVVYQGKPTLIDLNKTYGMGGSYVSREARRKGFSERSRVIENFFVT